MKIETNKIKVYREADCRGASGVVNVPTGSYIGTEWDDKITSCMSSFFCFLFLFFYLPFLPY